MLRTATQVPYFQTREIFFMNCYRFYLPCFFPCVTSLFIIQPFRSTAAPPATLSVADVLQDSYDEKEQYSK